MNKKVIFILLAITFGSGNLLASDKDIPENIFQRPFEIFSPHPDLEIEVKRCVMNGNTAVIEFLITNLSVRDIKISFYGGYDSHLKRRSVAYDDEGNSYPVRLGVSGTNRFDNERLWNVNFPSETPVKLIMQVPDIDPSASCFSRVNLFFYCDDLGLTQSDADKNNFRVKNLVIHGR